MINNVNMISIQGNMENAFAYATNMPRLTESNPHAVISILLSMIANFLQGH